MDRKREKRDPGTNVAERVQKTQNNSGGGVAVNCVKLKGKKVGKSVGNRVRGGFGSFL